MLDVRKITAGGSFAATSASASVSAADFQPPSADWFGQSQKLNKIVGGLKWASSSWNLAIGLDRERADLPPVAKPGNAEDYKMSFAGLLGIAVLMKGTIGLMFWSIINACSPPATNLINIIATPDSIHLKDREARS